MSSGDPSQRPAAAPPISAGLFVISVAVLALQVLQTRVLSVQMWHHHSYMVVTMTLLGWAAAGALVTVRPGLLEGNVGARLAWCGVLFALTTLGGYLLLGATADRAAELTAQGHYWALSLFYSYLLLPYFAAGLIVTIALSAGARDVHRLYFVNLVGSALGAWVYLGVIAPLGAERLLVLLAACGPLAGLLFVRGRRGELGSELSGSRAAKVASGLALVVCLAASVLAPSWLHVKVASSKAETDILREDPGARVLEERWSSLCRLDFVQLSDQDGHPGPINIYQDGDAITVMHSDESFAGVPRTSLNTLAYLPHALARERGASGPDVLAIGIGGGIDLRYALDQGASSVLGIEINPVTVAEVGSRPRWVEFNDDVYKKPGVTVELGEGRSTLRRLEQKFDVIQLSGTDTYTAGNAGAYVLSESYLYTQEALGEYLDHLEPHGTLGIIRLDYDPPRESLRLFAIGLTALRERGVADPARCAVAIVQENPHPRTGEMIRFAACVFSVDPLPEDALAFYRRAGEVPGHRLLWAPDPPRGLDGIGGAGGAGGTGGTGELGPNDAGGASGGSGHETFAALAAAIRERREDAFYDDYPWNVRPVDDDAPFFFNFHRWSALYSERLSATGWHDLTGGPIGLAILATLLVQSTLLVALLVILPLVLLRRAGLASPSAGRHLAYFLALGAGFMALEISTAQRLVLFLGHPTYSLSVTLSSFLCFAGLGALWSRRFQGRPARSLRAIVPLLAVLVVAYAFLLEPIESAALALALPARIAVAVALLAPLNFLMGMPFPLGLARLERLAPRLVPWAMGANGGASVVASIVCIVLAMALGFRAVSLSAAAIYLAGTWLATSGPLAPGRSGE